MTSISLMRTFGKWCTWCIIGFLIQAIPWQGMAVPSKSGKPPRPKATAGVGSREVTTTSPTASPVAAVTTPTESRSVSTLSKIAEELARSDTKTTKPAAALVVTVPIGGELAERAGGIPFFGPRRRSLKDTLELCVRLRDDAAVSTVVLELSALTVGTATVQELRQAVADLRSAGKDVVAVMNDDSQSAYLLASACNEIVMPPSNALLLVGAKVESYFFKKLLEKIGARAEVIHIGQYKAYGEMFTEDDFTTPARENLRAVVDDAYLQLVEAVAAGRRLTSATVEALVDRGPLTAAEALRAGLVDRLAYREEILDEYRLTGRKVVSSEDYVSDKRSKSDEANLFALFSALSKGTAPARETRFPAVAVVYAVGPIVPGSSDRLDLSDAEEIAADDYLKILDEIEKDNGIKGVILRVNSPGGSAFASDVLFRRIVELGKKKPVIASMGDVAASGGYYLAMAANTIIANPMTITGSIGVVGGKIDLGGTYKKLGISKTTIARGRFATLFSETGGFSSEERAVVEKLMRQTYDEFVAKAAAQRKMTTAALEQLAQGRVYTGVQAQEVHLVDAVGGFATAVKEMKRLLGLQPDDKISLVAYPKELTLLDILQKAMGTNVQLARVKESAQLWPTDAAIGSLGVLGLSRSLEWALSLAQVVAAEHVAFMMPWDLRLN
ncbi:MAG: signal peptide peptidase SppA [Candidatus Sumerlaeaceae bacterium]|nr:signal peptide peptidase SppA [Candidatus Sumerlaeaceae bacterium]